MKKLTLISFLIFQFSFLHIKTYSQDWEWVKKGGGSGADIGHGIVVDSSGNVYVTGYFNGTALFGNYLLTSAGLQNVFVVKYDNYGNVLWVKQGGGIGSAIGNAIAIDGDGYIYVAGTFDGAVSFGSLNLISSPGISAAFVIKYDAAGNEIWAKQSNSVNSTTTRGIDIDGANNIYIAGSFGDTIIFGSTMLISEGSMDLFVVKYDNSGSVLWAIREGYKYDERVYDIAVNELGFCYVTGYFRDTVIFDSMNLISAGSDDVYVVKFDTSGNVLWANQGGSSGSDQGWGVALDYLGNCYITGSFDNTASFGGTNLVSAGGSDIFLVKYDNNGNQLWAKRAGGISSDRGNGVTVDVNNNCYITGYFSDIATFGSVNIFSPVTNDMFVAKYDSLGNVFWVEYNNSSSGTQGFSVIVDNSGDSYITGQLGGTAVFGNITLFASASDVFVAKLSNCPAIFTSITGYNVSCYGGSDGAADLTVIGGTSPLTYSWSNATTTEDITNLAAGTYTINVTDFNGCTANDLVYIYEPGKLNLIIGSNPATPGNNDGEAWVSVSGGVPPYFYQWDDTAFQTNDTAFNLSASTYQIVVTDNNGCKDSSNVTVSDVTRISDNKIDNYVNIYPNPVQDNFIMNFEFNKLQTVEIKIYNLIGDLIYKIPKQKILKELFKVDFSNQPNGIYYVKIITKEGILTRKIVLIR